MCHVIREPVPSCAPPPTPSFPFIWKQIHSGSGSSSAFPLEPSFCLWMLSAALTLPPWRCARRVLLLRTERKHVGLWSGGAGRSVICSLNSGLALAGSDGSEVTGWDRVSLIPEAPRLYGGGRIPARKIMCPCECQSSVSKWWGSMFSVSSRQNKLD